MGKRSVSVEVTPKQRAVLEPLTRAKVAPQRLVERCRIVLMSAEGRNNEEQADELGVDRQRVRRWRVRWVGASAATGRCREWRRERQGSGEADPRRA
ncbi:MAG: helix-turn-helix domain-containing protein [Deltaproteobacteria bacterium]|nr:helix-turn-helix domain-containing protein [Deltaproteobacteria bacterium]